MKLNKVGTGVRVGRLILIERYQLRNAKWLCRCDCGKIKQILEWSLKSGNTQSCGCLRNQRVKETHSKHGMYKTTEYRIWIAIKQRCNNPNNTAYKHYGGRGISVCARWENSFENFLSDMGNRPKNKSKNKSIDRIDNNKGYSPDNCRWATQKVQANNKRERLYYKNGVKRKKYKLNGQHYYLPELCKIYNHPSHRLWQRIHLYGWTVEKAVSTPYRKENGRILTKFNVDGNEYTIKELSTVFKIPSKLLYSRIITHGWDAKKAVTEVVKYDKR